MELNIFKTITIYIPVYYRYVDDIIIATPKEYINISLCSFNSYHERINFTVEYDGGINFLDVELLIEDGRFIFDNYKKPTYSGT